MSDVTFINGLMIKPPVKKDGSPLPDFIKAKGSIKRLELIETLQNMDAEWVNFDVKESKAGNWYAALDNWEPDRQQQEYNKGMDEARQAAAPQSGGGFPDDDIPFAPYDKWSVV